MKNYKFDIDLVSHIDYYSAYVYRITITFKDGTIKIYIGAHKGLIYDAYDFSSEDEDFLRDLRNPDTKVYFEIVMKGSEYDMFDLENQMLEKVDAKNNDQYYNKTNGGSRYTSQSARKEAFLDSIIEKCKNGEFDKYIKKLPVKYIEEQIKKHGRVQIRDDDEAVADMEYCTNISDEIDLLHGGDTSFLPPCLAFGDWGTDGDGILWEDGTQRYTGVQLSKRGKELNVIVLPKEEYKEIAGNVGEITQDMIDLAFLRNPLEPSPLPMKPKELAKRVFDRSKSKAQIRSDWNFRFLTKQKRIGKAAEKIINAAEILWDNREEAEKKGKGFHYYDAASPEGKKIIDDAKTKSKKDFPDSIVWGPYSSSTFGPAHVFGVIQKPVIKGEKYPTKIIKDCKSQKIVPLIYHSSTKDAKDWDAGKAGSVRQLLDDLGEKYNIVFAEYEYVSLIAKGVTAKATK